MMNPSTINIDDYESLSLSDMVPVSQTPPPNSYVASKGRLTGSQPGFLPKHPDGLPVYGHTSMLVKMPTVVSHYEASRHLRLTMEDKAAADNEETVQHTLASMQHLVNKMRNMAVNEIRTQLFEKMRDRGLKCLGNPVTNFDDCKRSFRYEPKVQTCEDVFYVIYTWVEEQGEGPQKTNRWLVEISKSIVKKCKISVHKMDQHPKENFAYKIAERALKNTRVIFGPKGSTKTKIALTLKKSWDHPLGPPSKGDQFVFQPQNICGWKELVKIDGDAKCYKKNYMNFDTDSDITSLGVSVSSDSTFSSGTQDTTQATLDDSTFSSSTTLLATRQGYVRMTCPEPRQTPVETTGESDANLLHSLTGRLEVIQKKNQGENPAPAAQGRMLHPGKLRNQGGVAVSTPDSLGQESASTLTHEGCGCNCTSTLEVRRLCPVSVLLCVRPPV